ncbi:MAG TPA: hypothetical protein PLV68_03900 [Ilumatobacteraceae bacterium]|nr:hypothetical protein [Ilumatobacteraceae bacterium]
MPTLVAGAGSGGMGILSTGALMMAAGNTYEHPGSECRTRSLDAQLWTQPATNQVGLLTPPVAVAVDNYQGAPRPVDTPLPTQVGSETMAVVSAGVLPFRKHTIPPTHAEPMPTFTADQVPGLITAAGYIKNNGSIDEAGYRAHPLSSPLGTVVGSATTQGLLFSGWSQQAEIAEWRDRLEQVPLDDCCFRMLFSHEVGYGCGVQVDHPMYGPGDFIVWGSARDQVDGFGNMVSPQVGEWIGARMKAVIA